MSHGHACARALHTHLKTVVHLSLSRSALVCLSSDFGMWWICIAFLIQALRFHICHKGLFCASQCLFTLHTSYIYKNTNLNFSWLKNSFLSIPVSYNTTKVLIDWISTVATQTKEVRHFCGNSQLVVDTIFTVRLHSSVFLVCLAWIKHHFCFGFSEWIDFIRGNSGSPKLFHNFERHRPTEEVIWHKGFGLDFHENWNTK